MEHEGNAGPPESERRYCEAVIEELATLRFEGMSSAGKPICLPLEDVYVELAAVSEVPDSMDFQGVDERRLLAEAERRGMDDDELRMHMDSLRLERWRDEGRAGRRTSERRSIENAIADPSRPGLVILGDPGAGKSTLLRYVALRAARACVGTLPAETSLTAGLYTATGRPRLPVLVPLAAYDDHLRRDATRVSLADFLATYFERWRSQPGLGPLFAEALDEGRALILLDGLDEVLTAGARRHVVSQVQALIQREAGRGSRFVITSRVIGYREAPLAADLPRVVVLDLGPAEIERFARQWCEACEVWLAGARTEAAIQRGAREASALLTEVRTHPQVQTLAANPLLLTMLALLRRQGGKLPDQRIELYRRYLEILLDNGWENARSHGARTAEPERFDQHWALDYLMDLSLWLQENRPSGTARARELEEVLVDIGLRLEGLERAGASYKEMREARQRASKFLEDMRHFAGLLGERGQDAFGFLHLTLQEYLAGRALARMDAAERWRVLAPHLHRPRWRESILLCAGQLGTVERRRRDVSALVRQVLGAGSEHEDILHRDLFLAAALAADNVGLDRVVMDDIAERLIALQDDRVQQVRLDALRALARLARIGHERSVTWLHERIVSRKDAGMTSEAVRDVLGAEPCAPLRQALCAWLKKPGLIEKAAWALGPLASIDPTIRAFLIEAAKNGDYWDRLWVFPALPADDPDVRAILVSTLQDSHPNDRSIAMSSLSPLAAHDHEIRDLLVAAARDRDDTCHDSATMALAHLAPHNAEIRALLLEFVRNTRNYNQDEAIIALAQLAATDSEARELLLNLINSSTTAIEALAFLAPRHEEVRSALLALTRDKKSHIRQSAFQALATFASTLPLLHALVSERLGSETWDVRDNMLCALAPVARYDSEIRTMVLSVIEDRADPARKMLIAALAPLAHQDAGIRAVLVEQACDPDDPAHSLLVNALAPLIHKHDEVRSLMFRSVNEGSIKGQWAAFSAIAGLAAQDPEARAALRKVADGPTRMTIEALAALAPHDAESRSRLLTFLDHDDEQAMRTALKALAPIASDDRDIRTQLLGRVDDPDNAVRAAALAGLAQIAAHPEISSPLFASAHRAIEHYTSTKSYGFFRFVCMDAFRALKQLPQRPEVRACLLTYASSRDARLREQAIDALQAIVHGDEEVRALLLAATQDEVESVRGAAIRALSALVAGDDEVSACITRLVNDPSGRVRLEATSALAPAIPRHPATWERFLPWLGIIGVSGAWASSIRCKLADAYGPILAEHATLRGQVIEMLRSPAWPARQGAAWALAAMPGGPPAEALSLLRGLIHDERDEESWTDRVQAAEIVLNDRDVALSRRAIAVLMSALDYAIEPWYCFTSSHDPGPRVRAAAAQALGKLRPLYRDEAIIARLIRLMSEDTDDSVRDAVYTALLRLTEAPEPAGTDDDDTPVPAETALAAPPAVISQPSGSPMHTLPASTILHLSDLHFGTAANATTWYTQLAEDLAELACTRLDAIILSGDIGNRATPDEYAAARAFLDKLMRELSVPPTHVILVPGNHDLAWPLSKEAYRFHRREDYAGSLDTGSYIEHGDTAIEVRDEDAYRQRFAPFARFYEDIRGEPYPLDYAEQGTLHHLAEQKLLILGLNSAWNIDHHFHARASIHPAALAGALDRIRQTPAYRDCPLKLAVWHHPIHSASEDRIKDDSFLQQLAKAGGAGQDRARGFRLALHGHIHKAEQRLFQYDVAPAGRRIDILSAGTFGAPVREWMPGHPLQYNLLRFQGTTLTVDTRCREAPGGAWRPDARWLQGPREDPRPRYTIEL